MSGIVGGDLSALAAGSPAELPAPTVAAPSGAGRPNLVAMAAVACVAELLALVVGSLVSSELCQGVVAGFHAPQPWLVLLISTLVIASIAERGDYGAGVLLDGGLRPWSLAKASLQTGGAVLLLAAPSILLTQPISVIRPLLGPSAEQFLIGGTDPAKLLVWVLVFLTVGYLTVLGTRVVGRTVSAQLARPRRIVVVGNTQCAGTLMARLQQASRRSMKILGVIDTAAKVPVTALAADGQLYERGRLDELVEMAEQGRVDAVVVALPWSEAREIRSIVELLGGTPVDVLLAPDAGPFDLSTIPTTEYADIALSRIVHPPLLGWQACVKRAEDIAISGAMTLLAAPAILAIALLIKLTSPGPVFFRQQRYGYKGQVFRVFKFRTMYTHLADPHGTDQTRRGDHRITRVGAWLRRTSLDELPQLLNVLRGDMSLVGPRPHPIGMTARGVPLHQATEAYRLRQRVRPGLTGWAQVNGNRGPLNSCDEVMNRVALDLEYIRDWSLAFDLKIMWLTIRLLINDKNAY
jgi:Undecaprenyl-phosphate glucose phosphotransferase